MKFKKAIPIMIAALALSATLFGCGSEGSTTNSTAGNTSAISSTAPTTSITPDEIMAKIKEQVSLKEIQSITENDLSAMYGIDMTGVKSFSGETDSTGLQVVDVLVIDTAHGQS